MTKIDIFSGFLGAGKTTLIKKMLNEAYQGEKLMLIENEFGEIGIDGGFMQDAGIEVTEMNSGCICCSLVGDFGTALKKALDEYHPDRILIEPSGVGKLSDVIRAVQGVKEDGCDAVLNGFTTVVDANKCKMYMKNFGEFFNDQIENAGCIVLSHTDRMSDAKIEQCVAMIREHNATATVVVTPWSQLSGAQLLEAMERKDTIEAELDRLAHAHHHHHDGECDCGCDHDHEHHHEHHEHEHEHEHHHEHHEHEHEHHHEHHDHDHEHEHHHEHHDHEHEHDEHCSCGCHHDHDHHHGHDHHHHADEVFESFGCETAKKFTKDEINACLSELQNAVQYGIVLRAKGIVAGENGEWIHFDYVPGEADVRTGSAAIIGRLCVIGSHIDKHEIAELFGVEHHH
jgi:G3E family GTPase